MNQVAIVTGGSSGIGLACAKLLAERGYTVYEFSRHGQENANARHIACDVTNETQVRAAVQAVVSEQGKIDLLVNNAGFGISGAAEFTSLSDAHAQFDVNFFGALTCTQAVLPHMRAQKNGRVVFISSVAAPIAIPYQAFYSACKAAINSLMLALRNEVKPFRIQVCAVQPGDVKTGFTAARRKSPAGADVYGAPLSHAVSVMEHDEQNGMPPEAVARVVCKAASAKRCKALYTVGAQYKLFVFIAKVLPASLVNALVGMIYK